MQKITLYKYIRSDGGTTVSPIMPNLECSVMFRLVADDGMMLSDGTTVASCIDTDNPSVWTEVVDIESAATESDYQNALREMGVSV